ncbi:MAG: deoxyribodipyrimidine photo-lyase [Methylobacteriaceae bacterium]|jgi:deoxyribodipyrimidine photo-lyase|nr:deoxyribodipyrimidine photo-lyase [Methylobacteriaceae bacterium]
MIEAERLKELNNAPEARGEYVLYWMQQSQRESFSPALEAAIASANRLNLPVLVCFGLTDGYPDANARHYAFMLEGLRETGAALTERGVAFAVRRGSPDDLAIALAERAAMMVCDRGYLRIQKRWRTKVAQSVKCRVSQIEGDVVVPVEHASQKREVGARTLRPTILRVRDDFLQPTQRMPVRHKAAATELRLTDSLDLSDVPALLQQLDLDRSVPPVMRFRGGYRQANRHLETFLHGPLQHYASARREPAAMQVSFLSAYLHFGQISPVEVALAARDAGAGHADRASYLEELVVRRELAMNFVEYMPDYDNYSCLPAWAKETLTQHKRDKRSHIYSQEQLAEGKTHDPYWNAAMAEMRGTGYMHNHMRMYWGKKILDWSKAPEEGYATALTLNNRYFLCGRDANSFANIAWCFGLHDRPWPERPVFGKVRSMTAAGLERKIDVHAYMERVAELIAEEIKI